MKPLKVALLLAVFVLTVSGREDSTKNENTVDLEIQKIDKQEFKLLVLDTEKKKKPDQNI